MNKSGKIWISLGLLVGLMTIPVILKFREIIIMLYKASV